MANDPVLIFGHPRPDQWNALIAININHAFKAALLVRRNALRSIVPERKELLVNTRWAGMVAGENSWIVTFN